MQNGKAIHKVHVYLAVEPIDYVGICLMTEYTSYYFNKRTYLGPYAYGGIDCGFLFGFRPGFLDRGRLCMCKADWGLGTI